ECRGYGTQPAEANLAKTNSSTRFFAPIVHGDQLGSLQGGVTVKEQEVGSASMTRGCDPAFRFQNNTARSVEQVFGAPNVVQVSGDGDAQIRDNRTPRAILVIGKINRVSRPSEPAYFCQAVDFPTHRVQRAAELPGV